MKRKKKSSSVHPHYGSVIATAFVVSAAVQLGVAAVESPMRANLVGVVPTSFEDFSAWWLPSETGAPPPPTDEVAPSADEDCDEELVSLLRDWSEEQRTAIRALADIQGDMSVGALVASLEVLGRLPVGFTMEQVWNSAECIARNL